jgi:hypothetical protein
MLLDIKFLMAGSYGFWENLRLTPEWSLERKKFPVISSLEGRVATFPGDPLKKSFGKKLREVKKLLDGAKFSV